MNLYREARPDSLSEIIGNESIIKALEKLISNKKKPQAILIHGPSGCGKTTIGRIIAKAVGAIEDSIFELNAANTRGVDDIREIARSASLSTLGGKAKAYIVDESHQLTAAAQECFLKLLEDPPKNCYFIFCTTEPQNLIATIRNRCTDYEVRKLTQKEIITVCEKACEKAKLEVPNEIIQVVAATNDGSARAALVALEKVKDIKDLDIAIQLLLKGTENDARIKDLCNMINCDPSVRKQKWSTIINTFDMLDDPPEMIRKSMLTYLYSMLVTCSDDKEAVDLAHLISIFSHSVFYGGKSQLGALIVEAIWKKNSYL